MQTTILTTLDWLLIGILLAFSIVVGFVVRDKSGEGGAEGFFAAGRKMRWYFLGTSIVATTFASDTPLAITGWIAQYGIAGNWFWWGGVIGTMAMTVFFARMWRSTNVLTDAEIAELRYGGAPATVLRTFKATLNATFVNCIILGWVFAGMAKISEPFMDWQSLLGLPLYSMLESIYPEFLIFHSFDNTLTIMLLVSVTLLYSALGGIKAVIITDLVQFTLAMVMSILLTWFAIDHIGGLDSTWARLAELYPSGNTGVSTTGEAFLSHEEVSAFVPSFDSGGINSLGIPFSAFVLTLGFLWWTSGTVDGSGFIAQRLYTARDGGEAEKGAFWYAIANFMLRSWPWALAGVAALVIYPRADINQLATEFSQCANNSSYCSVEMQQCLDNRYACNIDGYALLYKTEVATTHPATSSLNLAEHISGEVVVYLEDRERSYPALMRDVLPVGLLGLALASLMAAFMSTISTHINWGASYMANDIYSRFINPTASHKQLTFVSRLATVGITLLSVYVATLIDNIGSMWELYGGLMAGLGLPHLFRWLWWRANAWTELSGMLVGFLLAFSNYLVGRLSGYPEGQMSILPPEMATHPIHVICWISVVSGIVSVVVTLLTPAVKEEQLKSFVQKVNPMGFWKGHNEGYNSERSLGESLLYFLVGTAAIYAGMFGIGHLLRLEQGTGILLIIISVALIYFVMKGMSKIDASRQPVNIETS